MGTLLTGSFRSLKFAVLAGLFLVSISVQAFGSDDPQSEDGDGDDTALARSAVSRTQI